MSFIPKPHEIYKHFKGNLYQITAIAEHTETGETLVVYQAMYGDFKTYARPLDMFISLVDRDKYPDAAQEFRFELQGPDAARQRAELGTGRRADSVKSVVEPLPDSASPLPGSANPLPDSATPLPDGVKPLRESVKPLAAGMAHPAERRAEPPGGGQTQGGKGALPGASWQDRAGSVEQEAPEEELNIDPQVLEFLDADSYEQRLNILTGLHHRITDDMITTMAIACDVEIGEDDIEERYESLKMCLLTMERYECNRLR